MKVLFALLALLTPIASHAANGLSLVSTVLVERTETTPEGRSVVTRAEPGVVTPGDSLVFVLSYRNDAAEPATGFVLTNPVPAAVSFSGTDDPAAQLSVDGGKTWGGLDSLSIAQEDGTTRAAEARDVTHIRWSFAQPVPSGGSGELSFRGVVK